VPVAGAFKAHSGILGLGKCGNRPGKLANRLPEAFASIYSSISTEVL